MTGVDAAAIPLSLYLHFPWCVAKCPYCDFNSHGLRGAVPEDAYIAALIRDLDFELLQPESRPIQSIFMGGGTPSLFSGRAIASVLEAFAKRLSFAPDIEITLEANPGTVDAGYFRDYRTAGVNRLSIGVQSLNDAMLKRLGRIHGHDDAVSAVRIARAAGFDNLNLDLMFALPEQTEAEAAADLREAIALGPEHLSYYQLTLEPNTEFAARPPKLPDDDAAWAMQLAGQALLAEHGYAQYEVSAYAQVGRQSRHNRNYWQFGDYLGIGAGAHGKRTFADRIERRARHKLPKTYQAAAGQAGALQEQRQVGAPELPFEFAMNALRLNEGFSPALFEARTGLARSEIGPRLAKLAARGLLEQDDAVILPTALGRAHLNTLISEFL
ncbi:radical SAM family heme chaperone HemW [Nevskia ramosa]|uniref:radical SAM family heme chaperone HemW n=1 Tax=Nevskia ramosa TaxID=64002 RepID=UPI0003B7541A|nr:radical SAM family heme chaperone HemW [Nevskia ramosa]